MDFIYDGISIKNKRQSNMDSLLLKFKCICNKKALLAVVCDGVGSLECGLFASGTAVKMLNEWFERTMNLNHIGLILRDIILAINAAIVSESKLKKISTASTLSALLLIENDYYIAHIGDSRIYSLENDKLSILTYDDVSATGRLTSYLGQDEQIVLQYAEGVVVGKVFMLCSDGLHKRINDDFLTEKLRGVNKRTIKETAHALAQYVIDCGEQDNISIALMKAIY